MPFSAATALVVDDDSNMCRVLELALASAGCRATTVGSGQGAIALFADHPFPVVLVDARLPDMEGWRLIAELRRLRPEIRVIMEENGEEALRGEIRGGSAQISRQSLDDLLRMARVYQDEGSVWQAIEMYWSLSEEYSATPQSLEAQKNLLELAETYEREGSRRMARAIYERLIQ